MRPPPIHLSLTEAWRTLADLASLPFSYQALSNAPEGDGHPVLVLPGFMATDGSTYPLREFIRSKGYSVFEWGLGRNLGPTAIGLDGSKLRKRFNQIADSTKGKISLVGWSLGGVMARELAKERPESVRQVITLGSPFKNGKTASHVWHMYKYFAGHVPDDSIIEQMANPPSVPCTSIYTKADGVVHWESCLETISPTTDNIEIAAAHCGLGFNASAWVIIAKKLAMADGRWKKLT